MYLSNFVLPCRHFNDSVNRKCFYVGASSDSLHILSLVGTPVAGIVFIGMFKLNIHCLICYFVLYAQLMKTLITHIHIKPCRKEEKNYIEGYKKL